MTQPWTIRNKETGDAVLVDPITGEILDDVPVPGELAGGEANTLHFHGRIYELARVRIEDLPDWCQAHKMHVAADQPPELLADTWPPAVLFEKE